MINLSKILCFYILLSIGIFVVTTTANSATPDENAPQDIGTKETNLTTVEAKANAEADINVEIDRRVTELRNEFLDDKADSVSWWLAVIAIVLTFFGLIIPIFGIFGYIKFKDLAKEAKQYLAEIKKDAKKAADYTAGLQGEDNKSPRAPDTAEEDSSKVQEHAKDTEESLPAKALPLQKDRTANELRQTITKDTVESNPDKAASTWFQVGFLYQLEDPTTTNQENNKNALDAYTHAIRLNPKYIEAYFNRGNVNAYLGKHRKSIEDYASAIEIIVSPKSNNQGYIGILKKLYFNSGNSCTQINPPYYSNAIANYDSSLTSTIPSDSHNRGIIYYNRGNAKFRIGNYSDAAEDYKKATLCEAVMRDSWYNLGNAQVKLREYEKALTCYEYSIGFDANFKNAHTNHSMVENASRMDESSFLDMIQGRNTARRELPFGGNSGSIGMYAGVSPPNEDRYLPGGKGLPGDSGFLLDNQ